jgi:rSAM/selenodomain-associated transferase 1
MRHLALFARPPVVGAVKSRLSPALPPRLACDLYRGMLADALALLRSARAGERVVFWADEFADAAAFGDADLRHTLQRGADLGERLESACAEMLRGPQDRAVIVGADCPWLDSGSIERSFEALERVDAVVIPARDGGYVLIGLSRPLPALFHGIEWGTGRVLAQTLERARHDGASVELLDALEDLDTPQDLVWALMRLSVNPGATNTRQALAAMGLLPGPVIASDRLPNRPIA